MVGSAVFVSPHLDDAALSCGGGIARLVSAGSRVTVITACTADSPVDTELSDLARETHARWVVGAHPYAERRAEDFAAVGILGAGMEHLGLSDAIYRLSPDGEPLYRELLGPPIEPHDMQVFLPQLAEALLSSGAISAETRVFCPLGTGGHVDHVLTRLACEQAFSASSLVYYDEYPYVSRALDEHTTAPDGFEQHVVRPTERDLATKIAAVGAYESQLGLFPSRLEWRLRLASERLPFFSQVLTPRPDAARARARMAAVLTSDTETLGGERYWWPRTSRSPFSSAQEPEAANRAEGA